MKINERITNSEYCDFHVIEGDKGWIGVYRTDLRPGNQFSNPVEPHFEYRKTKFECQELWKLLMHVYDAGYNSGNKDGRNQAQEDIRQALGIGR